MTSDKDNTHRGAEFFFVICNLSRSAVALGIVDRPIVIALIFSIFTQTLWPHMAVGIFFELLWLDNIQVGTYIPPNNTLATFLVLSSLELFHPSPLQLLLLLIIGIGTAYVGIYLEKIHRNIQTSIYERTLKRIHSNQCSRMDFTIYFSLGIFSILSIIFFISALVVSSYTLNLTTNLLGRPIPVGWEIIWGLSLIGGILSLRIKDSYQVLVVAFIILGILLVTSPSP